MYWKICYICMHRQAPIMQVKTKKASFRQRLRSQDELIKKLLARIEDQDQLIVELQKKLDLAEKLKKLKEYENI